MNHYHFCNARYNFLKYSFDRNWIGPAGPEQDAGPGTDFDAVRRGYISITPIHVDLTRYQALDQVAGWVAEISIEDVTAAESGS